MSVLLVTAFEPFGGEALNPSEMVLGMLPDEICGYRICKLVLPVEFGRSVDIAAAEYDKLRPAAVIMLGQAGGRSAITPETTARNPRDINAQDTLGTILPNDSNVPATLSTTLPKDSSAPATLGTTLPVDRIIDAISARGIRCERSDDAGAYVCNALFYGMIEHNRGEVPTGFIHVPYIKEQRHPDKPFMELSDIRAGIETAIATIIETVTEES